MIRHQRKVAAAAVAEEKTAPPDAKIVSAPEIHHSAAPAPAPVRSAQLASLHRPAGSRYADLVRALGASLPPDQLATLKGLLDAKEHAIGDAMDAAREAGVDPALATDAIQKAVAQEHAAIDERIKTEVGPAVLTAVQQFDASHPEDLSPPPPPADGDDGPPPPPDRSN